MQQLMGSFLAAQNLGLFDRLVRLIVGAGMLLLAVGVLPLDVKAATQVYAGLFGIYPVLSGMLGWDPLYNLFGARSCNISGRNPCGSLPYQLDAALGHAPRPHEDYDHGLSDSRHF